MITLFIGLALISIGVSAALIISKVRENALAAKKTKAVTDYVAPNQDEIDALESDVFGIGKEISGLPGYKWKIKQGISYTNDSFQVIYDPHGIEICLMNSMSGQAASKMLSSKRKTDSYNSRRPTYINRTVAEMDTRAQELMKEMVVKEISVREFAEGLKGIIKKYNGKPVE